MSCEIYRAYEMFRYMLLNQRNFHKKKKYFLEKYCLRTFGWLNKMPQSILRRLDIQRLIPFFHHDNASAVAAVKPIKIRYELLPHLPYSPDLGRCDNFCF